LSRKARTSYICYGVREKNVPEEREVPMAERPQQQAELAGVAGAIERLAGDLALAEEPSRFIAALERESDATPEA